MLNKIKIGPKLIGGFVIVAMIIVAVAIISYVNMKSINNLLSSMYTERLVPTANLMTTDSWVMQIRGDIYKYILVTQEREKTLKTINNEMDSVEKGMNDYQAAGIDEKEKPFYDKFMENWKNYKNEITDIITQCKAGNDKASIEQLLDGGSTAELRKSLGVNIDGLIKVNTDEAIRQNEDGKKTFNASAGILLFAGILAVLLAIVIGVSLTLSLTRPLARAVQMIQELGKGHLGMRLKMNSEDEIGIMAKTMDQFADDLQTVVVGTMKKISEGDVSMNVEIKDNQDEIAPALKNTVDALKGLISETKNLVQESLNGNLSTRGDADGFKGAYKEIIEGLNKTMEAIVVPINESSAVLEKVAARDMSARMKGDYKGDFAKMKTSINSAVDNLDQALSQVSQATEQVSSASQQISAGSQSLAQGANEQASSLEEISSSLEEMTSMTKQSADNANQAKTLAVEANGNAKGGVEAMKKMDVAIQKIKVSSDETSKIIKTIDEIAMQTNLLALNAAVEAARAGEAGRGFAVVAEEVRNLAQRSAEAAKNTANMIAESVKNADEGVKIAGEVSSVFVSIDGSVKKVNDLINEIAAASQEQSQGIEQVNTAVAQMDKVTQQNAANAEESASAAEELSSQAEELQGMVGQFALSQTTQGKGTVTPAHHVVHQQIQTPLENKKQKLIAAKGVQRKTHNVKAEEIIPMNEDELKEF
jgi:methyl-accepting chemotaxis protein